MVEIEVSPGMKARIDDCDLAQVSAHRWHFDNGYVVRRVRRGKVRGVVALHSEVMGDKPKGLHIDHADGDTLNNCRSNLRFCTPTQNQQNRRRSRGGSSAFKGSYWDVRKRKWRTRIRVNGVSRRLGDFDCEVEAAVAYDRAALQAFGQFARLNFPQGAQT